MRCVALIRVKGRARIQGQETMEGVRFSKWCSEEMQAQSVPNSLLILKTSCDRKHLLVLSALTTSTPVRTLAKKIMVDTTTSTDP
jgi:hypothetical protein